MASIKPTAARSSLAPGAMVQPQQQQQLGYGHEEHTHMLTAIRQPLFIQTPLQVMLETLVEKLQLQADVIGSLQDRVEGLERNKLSGSELLSRIQLVENRVDAATAASTRAAASETDAARGSPGSIDSGTSGAPCSASTGAAAPAGVAAGFSPFAQAKLVQQVAALEQQTAAVLSSSAQLAFRAEQVLLPRLQECENRLAGVTNLAGSLMAVDAMAAEIGINVPHPPLSALTAIQGGGLSPGPDTQQQQQQQQQQQGSAQAAQQQGSGNVLTVSRQQLLQQQIDDGRQQAAAMQQHLQHLQKQADKLSCDAVAVQDQQLGVLAGLQDGVSSLSDNLTQQVALLRREFKPALLATELHQTSAAEFTKVQRQVEALEGRHALLAKELAAFKGKEVAELASNLAQLSRRVSRITGTPGGALTETERALAAAQAELRGELVSLSARIAARDAADAAGAAVAAHQQDKCQDSGPPASAGRSRASQDSSSMHAAINRAVALALQAHVGVLSNAAADGSAASRSRCLVCDRALRDGSPPSCCTAPQSQHHQQQQSLSEQLLPLFDHFQPATAAAASASSSCSPHHTAATDAGGGGSSGSGGSSARHISPGRTQGAVVSSGVALGPKGPGLQAAQLRQISAHKAGRLAPGSSSSSLAAAAAGDCGIAGLIPVGCCAGELRGPGADGLIVSDLVSGNLRMHSAARAAPVAAAVPGERTAAGAAAGWTGVGLPSEGADGRQQEQQPVSFRGAAMLPTSRPQTAAPVLNTSEGRACAGRPSTAAAAARRPSSSRAAASSKRTPLFL